MKILIEYGPIMNKKFKKCKELVNNKTIGV